VDDGFTEWAAGVQRRLLRSAYLLTGDLHRAEDLVQEALVKVAMG
jgi:DNA-directed RNA polymerase specialized sigma24 family protein